MFLALVFRVQARLRIVTAQAVCFALLTSPASAALVSVTYKGFVQSGMDTAGLFGAPGSSLAGDAFAVVYTFDTSLGATRSSADYNYARGGLATASASPALDATVTIAGRNFAVSGVFYGETTGYNSSFYSTQFQEAKTSPYFYVDNSIISGPGNIPSSITGPFIYNVSLDDNSFGSLSIGNGVTTQASASFYNTQEIIASTVSGVPEAGTWAMMLLGLGGIGILARRKGRLVLTEEDSSRCS